MEGLDLGGNSEDAKKKMDLQNAVKQTWQGWLRDSKWETQERVLSGMISSCSGLTTHQVTSHLLR